MTDFELSKITGREPPLESTEQISLEDLAKLQAIARFAHRMLHVIDEAEVAADDSATVEIPTHDWTDLNELLEAISDDPHGDMHYLVGELGGISPGLQGLEGASPDA